MFVVSDVHGAFRALERVAQLDGTLLILGDLVNLIDYRTNEGIVPDVVGNSIVAEVVNLRAQGRLDEAAAAWRTSTQGLGIDVRAEVGKRMRAEYESMGSALDGAHGYATYGNVDDPDLLREFLPDAVRFVDAEIVDIDGLRIGFAGGGVPRIGSRGEVTDQQMRGKLETLGPVDVLCTHVPPDIAMLAQDVIASPSKGSRPILEYIDEVQPQFHLFGDVHQGRATRWLRGTTRCINVGYFRATGRPFLLDA